MRDDCTCWNTRLSPCLAADIKHMMQRSFTKVVLLFILKTLSCKDIELLWQVGDDEEAVRLAQAQVLMDCMADLLSQKGLDGTRAWCEGGLKLRYRSRGQAGAWTVLGHLPQEEGQGRPDSQGTALSPKHLGLYHLQCMLQLTPAMAEALSIAILFQCKIAHCIRSHVV